MALVVAPGETHVSAWPLRCVGKPHSLAGHDGCSQSLFLLYVGRRLLAEWSFSRPSLIRIHVCAYNRLQKHMMVPGSPDSIPLYVELVMGWVCLCERIPTWMDLNA